MNGLRATKSDLIYIYIFYCLQGETLYYNTAQHSPPE